MELHAFVFEESVPKALFDGFSKATGVRVKVETYGTNEALVEALRARPSAYDLIMPSDYTVSALVAAGELRPLRLEAIRNVANIGPSFLSPDFDPGTRAGVKAAKYSLPWVWGTTGILYDPATIQPPPTKWADLWAPSYAGKLVLLDDPREMLGIALQVDGHSKNDTDPAHLAAAKARILTLAAGAVALDSNDPDRYFADGSASIGVLFSGDAVLARRANPRLAYTLPTDGPGIWFDNLAIPKGAAQPEAAEKLIDWLLQANSGVAVIQALPYSNPNEAAIGVLRTDDPTRWAEYTQDPASTPSTDSLAGAVAVKHIGVEAQARYEAAWAEIIAARALAAPSLAAPTP